MTNFEFYEDEIKFREMMRYPPFSNMAILLLTSKDEEKLIQSAYAIKDAISRKYGSYLLILGPSPANISKMKNIFRWRIFLKGNEYRMLNAILSRIADEVKSEYQYSHINIQYDINPMMSY